MYKEQWTHAGLNVHVHVSVWLSCRYLAEVSLDISYNIIKKPCNILISTDNINLHQQRHVLPWIHASICIFIQYLTINIQPDVWIDVNCSICYRRHFRTCIAADGDVLNKLTHSMSHDRKLKWTFVYTQCTYNLVYLRFLYTLTVPSLCLSGSIYTRFIEWFLTPTSFRHSLFFVVFQS